MGEGRPPDGNLRSDPRVRLVTAQGAGDGDEQDGNPDH